MPEHDHRHDGHHHNGHGHDHDHDHDEHDHDHAHDHAHGPTPGTMAWLDLSVDDAAAARDFYASVVGWTAEPTPMDGYDDWTMADAHGEAAAGICYARGENAGLPPVWIPYFAVTDLDAAVSAATGAGGTVVAGPQRDGGSGYAVLRDPAGATFAVFQAG